VRALVTFAPLQDPPRPAGVGPRVVEGLQVRERPPDRVRRQGRELRPEDLLLPLPPEVPQDLQADGRSLCVKVRGHDDPVRISALLPDHFEVGGLPPYRPEGELLGGVDHGERPLLLGVGEVEFKHVPRRWHNDPLLTTPLESVDRNSSPPLGLDALPSQDLSYLLRHLRLLGYHEDLGHVPARVPPVI